MEKNLSKEFRDTMGEVEAMLTMAAISSSVPVKDTEDFVMNIELLRLFNRMTNLCCDMFEKQDKLMDKMDKVMDKYLEK